MPRPAGAAADGGRCGRSIAKRGGQCLAVAVERGRRQRLRRSRRVHGMRIQVFSYILPFLLLKLYFPLKAELLPFAFKKIYTTPVFYILSCNLGLRLLVAIQSFPLLPLSTKLVVVLPF